MKVVLISSTGDIADALTRAGVMRLLGDHEYAVLDRQRPGSVYFRSRVGSSLTSVPKPIGAVHRLVRASTAFSGADLVVNCGGPVMFHGVAAAAWQRPVWDDALGRAGRPRVLSVSGGSCFPWTERRPTELSVADESALRRTFRRTDLFTAGDREAGRLAEYFGMPGPVLPSVAMHAGAGEAASGDASTLIVNVMPGEKAWLRTMDEVVSRRARTDRILFLCHAPSELELANARWPEHQAVLPRSTDEYLDVARRGRVALVQHASAAVVLAGLGIPALTVGSDTRLLTAQETGQETGYVGDASARGVLASLDLLDVEFEARRKRLLGLEERAFAEHRDVLL
jgi:hypothetical protein